MKNRSDCSEAEDFHKGNSSSPCEYTFCLLIIYMFIKNCIVHTGLKHRVSLEIRCCQEQ